MAYRMRYRVDIDWLGPGGLAPVNTAFGAMVGESGAGGSTTQAFFNQGSNTSLTFTTTDISNMLTYLSGDISTQLIAAEGAIQGWATGGPQT